MSKVDTRATVRYGRRSGLAELLDTLEGEDLAALNKALRGDIEHLALARLLTMTTGVKVTEISIRRWRDDYKMREAVLSGGLQVRAE